MDVKQRGWMMDACPYITSEIISALLHLCGGGAGEVDRVAQDAAEKEAGHGAGDGAGCLFFLCIYK